ncbi:MAG TPA: type II secretion system F family protein [Acidobacteriaceae bacterium]|nr:type II secretion system F family protein [Acidobacteriaceae bacterium]
MGVAVFSFVVIFLLIGSAGLILFYREAMLQRIAAVTTQRAKPRGIRGTMQETGAQITSVVERLERVLPKSDAEVSVVKQRLIRAGFRNDSTLKAFYGAKLVTPLILCILLLVTGVGHYSPFFFYLVALGVGFMVPDFWLTNRIKKRKSNIMRGLPDALDLLIICVEAGLSLDQAVARAGNELSVTRPDLSDELVIVALEQSAGRPRGEAWKNFATRTDVEAVRSLVSVLIQSEKFGTSIARTLRVHSDTLRTQRKQKVEEQAAKTTVKLVFPLVFFIFPSIFVVTLGPAILIMIESFKKFFHN